MEKHLQNRKLRGCVFKVSRKVLPRMRARHNIRKRGQTTLEGCHIPLNWVDRLLGHVPRGAQEQTYSLPPVEKLRAEYIKAMAELAIYETPTSLIINDVAEEVTDQRNRRIVRETFKELLQKASAEDVVQLQQLLKRKLG